MTKTNVSSLHPHNSFDGQNDDFPPEVIKHRKTLTQIIGEENEAEEVDNYINAAVEEQFAAPEAAHKTEAQLLDGSLEIAKKENAKDEKYRENTEKIFDQPANAGMSIEESIKNFSPTHKIETAVLTAAFGLIFFAGIVLNYVMLATSGQTMFDDYPIAAIAFAITPVLGTFSVKISDASFVDIEDRTEFRAKVRKGALTSFLLFATLTALRFKNGGNGSIFEEFSDPSLFDQAVTVVQICSQFVMEALLGGAIWIRITSIFEDNNPTIPQEVDGWKIADEATQKSDRIVKNILKYSKDIEIETASLAGKKALFRVQLRSYYFYLKRLVRRDLE